jgi:hypothetical protein
VHGEHGYSLRLTMANRLQSDVGVDFHEPYAGIGAKDVNHLPVFSRDCVEEL